ncbi:MAG: 50S ribosomal protein L4 [Candidatus Diapherotrites archaeon]|nr:50S ribosomal protein L4 [Candidatus Diapherotrites archaeon]
MKVGVYSIGGKKLKEIELPKPFEAEIKPRLIKRAVVAIESKKFQPKGVKPTAGMETSAEYVGRRRKFRAGIGVGRSRLPRTKPGGGSLGRVRRVPSAVGGRRAHPPKPEKILIKKINKKEKRAALLSCIAATADKKLVKKRGYSLEGVKDLPIVVEGKFEKIKKTKEAKAVLENLGLAPELKEKRRIVVIVSGDVKSCKNLPGVNIATIESLNSSMLAPGTHAGVLTVWSENAIKKLSESYGS